MIATPVDPRLKAHRLDIEEETKEPAARVLVVNRVEPLTASCLCGAAGSGSCHVVQVLGHAGEALRVTVRPPAAAESADLSASAPDSAQPDSAEPVNSAEPVEPAEPSE